jgi:uncharacterized 2Fe-2S/4Fe-4S cluster protein (DUF4445 family)
MENKAKEVIPKSELTEHRKCTPCTCASNKAIRNAGLATGAIVAGLMTLFNS